MYSNKDDIYYKKYLKYKTKYFNLKGGVDIKRDTYGWGKTKNNTIITNLNTTDVYIIRNFDPNIKTFKLVKYVKTLKTLNTTYEFQPFNAEKVQSIAIYTITHINDIAILKNPVEFINNRPSKKNTPK